jgi:tetratricopeptide (TPR) repeat protein
MRRSAARYVGAAWVAALYCGRALAGDPPTSSVGPADVGALDAPPTESAEEAAARASKLEDEAFEEFGKGNYQQAAEILKRGYAIAHDPTFLFNLGVAYHWLGECETARDYYEQYLQREPRGEYADQAKEALEALYGKCGQPAQPPGPESPAPTPVPTSTGVSVPPFDTAPPVPVPSNHKPAWQAIAAPTLIGVGVATTFATILTLVKSREALDEYNARLLEFRVNDLEAQALDRHEQRYRELSIGFGVASGVLLGAGLGLLFADLGSGNSVGITGNGQAGITYRSQF